MSLDLYVAIDNARERIESVLPAYAAGTLTTPDLPHGLAILYRQLGTCQMLVGGNAAPFFVGQVQSASVYLFRLPFLADENKVESMTGSWWSAVVGGHWEAARDMARLSRKTHHPDREHEDDFLYVTFLMHRYCLAPPADSPARPAFDQQQRARLARWRVVLEGAEDPKLDLCEALQNRDVGGFQEALVRAGQQRQALLEKREASGSLKPELALWMKPIWFEGLALLRLAEMDGLGSDFQCPSVPPLIRVAPPFRYDANAWRSLDFKPTPVP